MKLQNHYFTLSQKFGTSARVYLAEIAETLQCTPRHAKTIIKQLAEKEWIDWKPAPGRGNTSSIRFRLSEQALQESQIKSLLQAGKTAQALKEMEKTPLEQAFLQQLQAQFLWTPEHINHAKLDVLSYPYYFPVQTFNPHKALTRHEGHIISHLFNCLLSYNYEKQTFELELLHRYEKKENGRVWRFFLRKGVYFHNGTKLTAETIKDNIELWKEISLNKWKQSMLAQIETITLDSSSMLTFRLTKPNHLFLHLFTDKKSSILPVSSYRKQEAEFDRFPIGTGPFKIAEHHTNYLKLEAFDRYFGYRPQLDQVELYRLPSGQLPIHNGIHYRVKQADTTETIIHDFPQTDRGGTYMVVNRQKPGLHTHQDFPKMLSYALDRQTLFSNHPYYKVWQPDGFFIRNGTPLRQTYKPDEARKWFKENGYVGKRFTLTSTCLSHNAHLGYEIGILQGALKEFGITLDTEIVDFNELLKPERMNQSDLIIAGITMAGDILASLVQTLSGEATFIYNTMPDEARTHTDLLVARTMASVSTQEAYTRLRELESYLLNHYHVIYLYERLTHVSIEADYRLQGIEVNSLNRLKYDKLWYTT